MGTGLNDGGVGASGVLRFARYALAPNNLGYCGPDDDGSLFEQSVTPGATAGSGSGEAILGLRSLAEGFEGAWPYLELIAGANGVADPLDDRVVSAYWLGGESLRRVPAYSGANHVEERFRRRAGRWWAEVSAALEQGVEPGHAFHVLVVGPWVGLLRAGRVEAPLNVMDRCRIRWGRVLEVEGDSAVVESRRLELDQGALRLGEPATEVVVLGRDGRHPCGAVRPGDVVSMHWDWVCEVLEPAGLRALRAGTAAAMTAANRSLAVNGGELT
jgi:hypothetical protein